MFRRQKLAEAEIQRLHEVDQLRVKEEKAVKEQEELRQREQRYAQLRQEEEAKRLEEVRLEQELRRQFELCQQQQQQQHEQLIKQQKQGELILEQKQEQLVRQQKQEQLVKQQKQEQLAKQQKEEQLVKQQKQEQLVKQQKEEQLVKLQRKEQIVKIQQREELVELQVKEQLIQQQQHQEHFQKQQQHQRKHTRQEGKQEQQSESLTVKPAEGEKQTLKAPPSPAPRRMRTKSWSIKEQENGISTASPLDPAQLLVKVKTGQVSERRNFWIRSNSAERLIGGEAGWATSPAPRRRLMDNRWNSHSQLANGEDGTDSSQSRPGSALGGHQQQPRNTGCVKQLTSGLLARSKSSAALTSAAAFAAPPPTTFRTTAWAKEKIDQHLTASSSAGLKSSIKLDEVRTNQVSETLSTWTARQREPPAAADRCPTPSSCIRQGFAENHSVRRPEMERRPANAWRSRATPEPQLRLVNVSVTGKASSSLTSTEITLSESVLVSKTAVTNTAKEKGIMEDNGGNIHEKTAQDGAGLDRPCQDNRTPANNTGQEEQDMGLPAAAVVATAAILAPPTPERNQSFAGGNYKVYKSRVCSSYTVHCKSLVLTIHLNVPYIVPNVH